MINHLSKFFSGSSSNSEIQDELPYITNKQSILEELARSKADGTVVGIKSMALGEDLFLTAVDDILTDAEPFKVVLKPYAVSGEMLTRNTLTLDQIRCVCPFYAAYRYPVVG